MKKTVTIEDRSFEIRSLTWGEKKQLKAEGYDLSIIDPEKNNDEMVERTIDIGCETSFELEALSVVGVYRLFNEIIKVSFVTEKDSKN